MARLRIFEPDESGQILVPYSKAESHILDADLLLFDAAPGSFEGEQIALTSLSNSSHVELAKWWDDMLCSVGMVPDPGGRAISLLKHVRDGRRIRVFEVHASQRQRATASRSILQLLTVNYNIRAIKRQVWLRLPFLRRWTRWMHPEEVVAARDDKSNGGLHDFMCIEGAAWVWQQAKPPIDITPNMANWAMDPVKVAESAVCHYKFTLIPDAPEAEARDVAA